MEQAGAIKHMSMIYSLKYKILSQHTSEHPMVSMSTIYCFWNIIKKKKKFVLYNSSHQHIIQEKKK